MSLSERVRPNSEAAPWVIEEIKALEAKVYSLENKVTELSWDGALNEAEDRIEKVTNFLRLLPLKMKAKENADYVNHQSRYSDAPYRMDLVNRDSSEWLTKIVNDFLNEQEGEA